MLSNFPHTHKVTADELAQSVASGQAFSEAVNAAVKQAGADAFVLAWISDIHMLAPRDYGETELVGFGTHIDGSACLQWTLTEVAALERAPDLVVFGGDLTNCSALYESRMDEFEEFGRALDRHLPRDWPSLPLLGNHDHGNQPLRNEFHEAYSLWKRDDWPQPVERDDFYFATVRNGWRFIGLDTRDSSPNLPLSERQREWLRGELTDTTTPTVILQHRPFVTCGTGMDEYRLIDPETFEMISGSPQVKAVLSGHTHKRASHLVGSQAHLILPSCAYGIEDSAAWACLILTPAQPPVVLIKQTAIQAVAV